MELVGHVIYLYKICSNRYNTYVDLQVKGTAQFVWQENKTKQYDMKAPRVSHEMPWEFDCGDPPPPPTRKHNR